VKKIMHRNKIEREKEKKRTTKKRKKKKNTRDFICIARSGQTRASTKTQNDVGNGITRQNLVLPGLIPSETKAFFRW